MARPANADAEVTRHSLIDRRPSPLRPPRLSGASTRDLRAAGTRQRAPSTTTSAANEASTKPPSTRSIAASPTGARRRSLAGTSRSRPRRPSAASTSAARAERDGVRLLVREVLDLGRLDARSPRPSTSCPSSPRHPRPRALARRPPGAGARRRRRHRLYVSRYVVQDDRSLAAAFSVRSAKEAHARAVATLIHHRPRAASHAHCERETCPRIRPHVTPRA